jgi:AcrR family transcriptional regulator
MPKVAQAHLDARRAQILAGARDCFAGEGFHSTSMADIFAASGLSAGAVYRYFRSKEEIVGAIAEEAGQGLRAVCDEVLADPSAVDPADALLRILTHVERQAEEGGTLGIALQVWAESLRNESLRERVGGTYRVLASACVQVCRRAWDAGALPADADPDAVGRMLFSLVPGFVVRRMVFDRSLTAQAYVADLRPLLPVAGVGTSGAAE